MDDVEAQEREHFKRIVCAFKSYRSTGLNRVKDREIYIKNLDHRHQTLLESYRNHLDQQKLCIEHNEEIIKLIIKDVENMFENVMHDNKIVDAAYPASLMVPGDTEKVHSTLKQIVRDWSSVGESERSLCYQPIIIQIEQLFPPNQVCAQDINILVPGAGLGRLAYELAKRGYACQGNEFSLFMLFASNFVLNKCQGVNCLKVYPWIHCGSNNRCNEDQLRAVTFPDVDPSDLPPLSQFSMAAGDFLEIYTEKNAWDCVATCFFIDCANNIVSFIDTIYKILKPGGYWVNLGPLLYHFEDQVGEKSIELSYEEVKAITRAIGFEITLEETGLRTTYTQDIRSMLKYEYESVFFVAKKPF